VEPFNVGAIQAMACGTPVIASDFGAFPETVTEGVTGFRCRTERQWIEAVDRVLDLPRMVVAATARSRFATRVVGPQYADAFGEMVEQATVANPFANDA
jgi:glycosyltransferase involved in cell wall biosynthesis